MAQQPLQKPSPFTPTSGSLYIGGGGAEPTAALTNGWAGSTNGPRWTVAH